INFASRRTHVRLRVTESKTSLAFAQFLQSALFFVQPKRGGSKMQLILLHPLFFFSYLFPFFFRRSIAVFHSASMIGFPDFYLRIFLPEPAVFTTPKPSKTLDSMPFFPCFSSEIHRFFAGIYFLLFPFNGIFCNLFPFLKAENKKFQKFFKIL
ncbi:MAG: hypothetical protein IJC78_08375, partial [Clostridia bacterium]|nr:hypothetical protein [Clostridia bacterium]